MGLSDEMKDQLSFLGGPAGPAMPGFERAGWFNVWIMPVFWFFAKLMVLLFCTVWVRATLPRLRYDQLMDLGWKYLIEIAFLWLMVSAVIRVSKDQGWPLWVVTPAAVAGAALLYGVLYLSMPKRDELVEEMK